MKKISIICFLLKHKTRQKKKGRKASSSTWILSMQHTKFPHSSPYKKRKPTSSQLMKKLQVHHWNTHEQIKSKPTGSIAPSSSFTTNFHSGTHHPLLQHLHRASSLMLHYHPTISTTVESPKNIRTETPC